MKYLIAILSASLLSLGILVYYQGRQAERQKWERLEDNKRHAELVSKIQAALKQEQAKVESIRRERTKTDSIFQASISAQKAKTAREQRKVTELRPQIDQLADSITVLAQFLEANDSLFANKAHEIAMLNQKLQSDSVSHDLETRHLNNQVQNLMSGHNEDHRTIDDLQRSLSKSQKRASKRLGFGFSGGYAIQENAGTLRVGPAITVGIQYQLFKF